MALHHLLYKVKYLLALSIRQALNKILPQSYQQIVIIKTYLFFPVTSRFVSRPFIKWPSCRESEELMFCRHSVVDTNHFKYPPPFQACVPKKVVQLCHCLSSWHHDAGCEAQVWDNIKFNVSQRVMFIGNISHFRKKDQQVAISMLLKYDWCCRDLKCNFIL